MQPHAASPSSGVCHIQFAFRGREPSIVSDVADRDLCNITLPRYRAVSATSSLPFVVMNRRSSSIVVDRQ
jgi:hypothetical protein